jgi:hypothetical protein
MLFDCVLIDCAGRDIASSGRSRRWTGVSALGGLRAYKLVREVVYTEGEMYLDDSCAPLEGVDGLVDILDDGGMLD